MQEVGGVRGGVSRVRGVEGLNSVHAPSRIRVGFLVQTWYRPGTDRKNIRKQLHMLLKPSPILTIIILNSGKESTLKGVKVFESYLHFTWEACAPPSAPSLAQPLPRDKF